MNDLDTRLARLLADVDPPTPPSIEALRGRTARRTQRRASVAIVVVLLAFVGAFQVGRVVSDDRTVVNADDPEGSSTTAPTTTTATSAPPTTTTGASASAVTVGPDGVFLVEPDFTTTLVDPRPAAAAYLVGDLVVVQPSDAPDDTYWPPIGSSEITVFRVGDATGTPLSVPTDRPRLLAARVLDGVPVALVAWHEGREAADWTETLALVDLVSGALRVYGTQPSWEAIHVGGAILDDGSLVGLQAAVAANIVTRWDPPADEPATGPTSSEIFAAEELNDLVSDGATAALVRLTYEGDDFVPTAWWRTIDVDTGRVGEARTQPLDDSGGVLVSGTVCTAVRANELWCAQISGPSVVIDIDTGAVRALDVGDATLVRPR